MRKLILVTVSFAALACAGLLFRAHKDSQPQLTLRAYYRHAEKVQKGMPVCVDGIQLGTVASVRVRPELGDRPVELVLTLNPPYELKIPAGSTAQIAQPGIFRPTVVDIDTRLANGPPLANGGEIEGRESTDDQAAHALGVVVKALADQADVSRATSQKDNKPAH
jgi:ABC-type transporter Mla subunit MlaD